MSSVYETPEWAAWLASIREMPDDDNRRLIAADFLEENGEGERAELIRVQCAPLYTLPCEQVEYPLDGVEGLETYSDIEVRCLCYHDGRTTPQDQWCPQCRARHRVMQIIEAGDDDNTRHVPHPFNADGWTGFVVKTYDRGFVHTVRGPLVSLIGGDCEPCGRGWLTRHADGRPHDCPACHGTGRTTGVMRELVQREPVELVEVTDREPCRHRIRNRAGERKDRWAYWAKQEQDYGILPHVPESSRIPPDLLDHMDAGYPTPDAARAALSAAILRLVQPVEVTT